jgi:hypothetical protein
MMTSAAAQHGMRAGDPTSEGATMMNGIIEHGFARLAGKRRLVLTMTLIAVASALAGASSASAGLQREFAVFSDCPVQDPSVKSCLFSTVTSGEFHIANKVVPINKTIVLRGGLGQDAGSGSPMVAAADGNTLSKTPLVVPGGLVGIELLPPLTEVTATAEIAGPVNSISVAAENATTEKGTAVALPLKVKLDNPVLGTSCYIGSDASAVPLQLTTGATSPPPPNGPISGKAGEINVTGAGKIVTVTNTTLVDNSFPVPGANGCAGLLAPVVDPSLGLVVGIPAAGGHNTAIMNGAIQLAGAGIVGEEAKLPELGRCQKGVSGRFASGNCIARFPSKWEWAAGPGPKSKFTGTGGSTTLQTVGNIKVKCSGSTSTGEYTGSKTAAMTVRFTGCERVGGGGTCQTAGAGVGEIVTSPLQGELGFIQNIVNAEGQLVASVGFDFKHAPSLADAECGSRTLSIVGSVIAPVSPVNKMALEPSLKFKAVGGKQLPEQFEEGEKDTLTTIFRSGSEEAIEQAGLTSTIKLHNEEKLEVKGTAE